VQLPQVVVNYTISLKIQKVEPLEREILPFAYDRSLGDTVNRHRLQNTYGFDHGRHDINDVVELPADPPCILNVVRLSDGHALPGVTEERRHLLGPPGICMMAWHA
jgi:hypothetical protein